MFGACIGFGNTFTVTACQRWASPGSLGRLNGLLLLTSFGLASFEVRDYGREWTTVDDLYHCLQRPD